MWFDGVGFWVCEVEDVIEVVELVGYLRTVS